MLIRSFGSEVLCKGLKKLLRRVLSTLFLSPERTSIRAKSLDPSAHLPVAMHSQNRNIYSIHVSKSFKHLKL